MRQFLVLILVVVGIRIFSQNIQKIKIRKPEKEEQKCSATLLGRPGGKIKKDELCLFSSIQVSGPCSYRVVSFFFSMGINGVVKEFRCDSLFSKESGNVACGLSVGDAFSIEKIKVRSTVTGQVFSLPDLKFKVIK